MRIGGHEKFRVFGFELKLRIRGRLIQDNERSLMKQLTLLEKGKSKEEVLSLLRSFKSGDSDWHDGRLFGLVYYAGEDVEDMAREAYASYMFENALSPFDFPSLL